MKKEWRKHEKDIYLPKLQPTQITLAPHKFYTIFGQGNPNHEAFKEQVAALYALSYGIRMMPKQGITPKGYSEYTVYPLEGIWSKAGDAFNKDDLIYQIMIRQPDFVTAELAQQNLEQLAKKKPNPSYGLVNFETIEDGICVQAMHLGPYENEPLTFAKMDSYCQKQGLQRIGNKHREIYLSDPRKAAPDKLKTVLRYFVE